MVESHKNIYKILFFGLVLILLYVLVWRVFENFFSCPGSSTVSWDYIRVTQKHSCQAQKKPILSQESLSAEQLRLWLSFSSWHFPLCPLCRCISGQMSMSFPLVWFLLHCEYYDFALQSLRTPCPLCVGFWSLWGGRKGGSYIVLGLRLCMISHWGTPFVTISFPNLLITETHTQRVLCLWEGKRKENTVPVLH